MRTLILFLAAVSAFAQATAVFPTRVATTSDLFVASNGPGTTLTLGINASATSATVTSGTGFVAPGLVTIDSEIMAVCLVSGNTLTFGRSACPNVDGRGVESTSAASHLALRVVQGRITAGLHNQLAAEVNAIETTAISTLKGLFQWNASRGRTTRNAVVVGDSVSKGFYNGGAGTSQALRISGGWVGQMTARLQATYGNHGPGLITTSDDNYTWLALDNSGMNPWTDVVNVGPYQAAGFAATKSATGTGGGYDVSISLTPPTLTYVDSFDVITVNTPTSGRCGIKIDNTGSVTVVAAANPATPTFFLTNVSTSGYVSVGTATDNSHFVSVGPDGSGQICNVLGVIPRTGTTGVTIHNISQSGGASSDFCGAATNLGFLSLLSPDLVIVKLGINDFGHAVPVATYQANLQRCVTEAQTAGASVIVGWENTTTYDAAVTAPYHAAAFAVAVASSAFFLDDANRWNNNYTTALAKGLMYDTVHPLDNGHTDIAAYYLSYLMEAPSQPAILRVGDGSCAVPSLSYSTETSVGFYHASGTIRGCIGGVQVFSMASNGVSSLGYGITSVTNPLAGGFAMGTAGQVRWNGDTGVGRYAAGMARVLDLTSGTADGDLQLRTGVFSAATDCTSLTGLSNFCLYKVSNTVIRLILRGSDNTVRHLDFTVAP